MVFNFKAQSLALVSLESNCYLTWYLVLASLRASMVVEEVCEKGRF